MENSADFLNAMTHLSTQLHVLARLLSIGATFSRKVALVVGPNLEALSVEICHVRVSS